MSNRAIHYSLATCLAVSVPAWGADEDDFVFRSYNSDTLPPAIEFVSVGDREVVRMRSEGELPLFTNLTGAEALYLPENKPKLGDVTTLEFEFNNETGVFGGGSPRFFLGLDLNSNGVYDSTYDPDTNTWTQEDGNLFIHLGNGGVPPWQGDPGPGWQIGAAIFDLGSTVAQYETAQVGGDTLGDTWADVQTLINPFDQVTPIIDLDVVAIGIAVDGGWAQDADSVVEPTDINSLLVDSILFEGMADTGSAFSEQAFWSSAPEPSTLLMGLCGLFSLAWMRCRR